MLITILIGAIAFMFALVHSWLMFSQVRHDPKQYIKDVRRGGLLSRFFSDDAYILSAKTSFPILLVMFVMYIALVAIYYAIK